ncbi:MAG: phosphotransferase [Pseudomonadota bacterium]
MTPQTRLEHIAQMAGDALALWNLPPGCTPHLLNVSENTTFLIQNTSGFKSVLRVHRQGYHSLDAILSELAWLDALERGGAVAVPKVIPGQDGNLVMQANCPKLPGVHNMVMFEFIEGPTPDLDAELGTSFEVLGGLAARCHDHALHWTRPATFERLTWDAETVFGDKSTWGDWRDAPGVDPEARGILDEVEQRIVQRLEAYGKAPERFNLIHADMRLANLIESPNGTRLIDFDDCGFGWLIYDFAAAVSFFEDDPRVPDLKAAWLKGYREVRDLAPEDEVEMDTMVMLRRMALLAWIGSHSDAPEPQALAGHFAAGTVALGRRFLDMTR